jgi:twitching motility protein PilI
MNYPILSLPLSASVKAEETYLGLQLDAQTQVVLSTRQTQEVVSLSRNRITPIPMMSESVLGLVNHRSRVFWLIDLPHLLGLAPLEEEQPEFQVVIVRSGNIPLGVGVRQILGIFRFSTQVIQSPIGKVSPEIVPYLKGCILLQEKGFFLVLDGDSLVNRPI